MKKHITIIALALLCALGAKSQITDVEKYDIIPDEFEEVYNDLVKTHVAKLINTSNGQYLGQTSNDGQLYGYGAYYSNNGSQIIGQYRNGKCMFGMTMGEKDVTIGTKDFYACYSLETGNLDFVFRNNLRQLVDMKRFANYRFEVLTYQNGERYVGETLDGKRHGYGIYYYMTGNYWYGQYQNGRRNGYGAMFTTDGKIFIGRWENGELSAEEKKSRGTTINDIIGEE